MSSWYVIVIVIFLPTKHIGVLNNLFKSVLIESEFGSVGFLGRGKPVIPEETLENQQQTQPIYEIYGVDAWI